MHQCVNWLRTMLHQPLITNHTLNNPSYDTANDLELKAAMDAAGHNATQDRDTAMEVRTLNE
jgi:hypothetical protein